MKQSKELNTVRHTTELDPELLSNVRNSIIVIRGKPVIADADVANLYGVETKRINEAYFVFRRSRCFAVEIFVHKTLFQKPVTSQSLYRKRIVYVGHDLEEQERIECNVCYYRNFHASQKLEKINRK